MIFTYFSSPKSIPPACRRQPPASSPSSLPPSPENHTDLSPPSFFSSSPIILAPKLQQADSGNHQVTSNREAGGQLQLLTLPPILHTQTPSLTPNSVAGPPAAASPLFAPNSSSSWRYYPPTFLPTHSDSKPSRYSLRACWPNLSEKQRDQLKKDRQAFAPHSPSSPPQWVSHIHSQLWCRLLVVAFLYFLTPVPGD